MSDFAVNHARYFTSEEYLEGAKTSERNQEDTNCKDGTPGRRFATRDSVSENKSS